MLPEAINRAAKDHADVVAYRTHEGWDVTYADLDRLSDEAAAWLTMRGLHEGYVLGLCMPSRVDYVVAYLAAAKVGAVTGGINPRFTAAERRAALDALAPDLILACGDQLEGISSDVNVEEITLATSVEEILASERVIGEVPEPLAPDPSRPVAVCFTSGSSGQPKGAWYENRQLQAIADLDTGGAWGGGGHRYASTELAHVGVMTKLPWLLASGGTTHMLEKWRAEPVLELIDRYRMGSVAAIAPQIALMLRVDGLDRFDFDCVKAIVSGGALAPPGLIRAGRELFGAPWSNRYSSTESGGVGLGTALDADDEEALYTVGRPRPGVEAEIRGDDGSPVADGEVGELWLRSPAVMSGYWNAPDTTAATLVDGWLRTGDLALIDDRGCFRLAGRTTEMYIRGGYNVYPLEVESVLSTHPKVAEVAIMPQLDEVMGEVGVAVVVPAQAGDGPTLDELRAHAAESLAAYKLPEAVRLVASLPKNASDKVDRRALQQGDG